MFIFVKRGIQFDRKHVIINNGSHAAGGFGLALLLQEYFAGGAFLPLSIAWVLVAFSAAVHLYGFTRSK